MKISLQKTQKERLRNAGLITVSQSRRGITTYFDPITGAQYKFSTRGYAYRKSDAGTYQLNPRFKLAAAPKGKRRTSATVRTNDAGALTELVLRGVRNFRG